MRRLHIITPVKDSIDLSLGTIRSIITSGLPEGSTYTVFNDRSTPDNRKLLEVASTEYGFNLVNLEDITDTPSPNYLKVLRLSRHKALEEGAHICLVESDVTVEKDTVARLLAKAEELDSCGMAATVTTDGNGRVNYPYADMGLPVRSMRDIATRKHLSFCCTLLTNDLLKAVDFDAFDDSKSWFDVTVSRESLKAGLKNYACTGVRVIHKPHGSRPWKHLKYKNPLKYYWQKFTRKRDRI